MTLTRDERLQIDRLYRITMDELKVAREAYAESATRVTRLTELANTLKNLLDK